MDLIGKLEFFTAFNKSFLFGFIAIPRSVTITYIRSFGPQIVVTSSTITGILSLNEGMASIVHLEKRQFCQPPIPCRR